MKKKSLPILIGTAVLTLACLCCPANLIPVRNTPAVTTPIPFPSKPVKAAPTTVAPTAIPTLSGEIQSCALDLPQVLEQSENGTSPASDLELNQEYTLVTYTVNGDALTDPVFASVPGDLKTFQQDTAAQEKIWNFITTVIPADQRTMVTGFVLYTDGASESLGAVEQTDDPQAWLFEMDLIDGGNFPDLATTVIHEFAHLLTLNDSQVTTDFPVFENPDSQPTYDREAALCPSFFTFEGCSKADSYLNAFFSRFWPDIYAEWQAIDAETDQDLLDQKLIHFYQKYAGWFVSEYAVTSPSEDIAETFMYFIFVSKPSGAAVSDRKIQFFYEYPELVALRQQILSSLCAYPVQP